MKEAPMPLIIRPPNSTADYRALAELLALGGRDAGDPQQLQDEDTRVTPPAIRR